MGEARIFQEGTHSPPALFTMGSGTAIAVTVQSPIKTTGNEDAALLLPFDEETAVIAVADGVGGMAGGAKASHLALKTLQNYLMEHREELETREALLQGIEAANQAVLALGIGAATTLSAVKIKGNQIQSFHVGDSQTLVVGQRGKIKIQTIPHSPVGYALEAGIINEKEALHHVERHLVSNILGTPEMRIEMGPKVKLAPRDTILVCSDGKYDNFTTDELVQRIRTGSLKENALGLVEGVLERMNRPGGPLPSKPDDFTFILFRLQSQKKKWA